MPADTGLVEGRPRHFSNLVSGQVVRYVAHFHGDAGVERLLAAAGDLPPRDVLEDPREWLTYDETKRLFEAAADMLGGAEGLRAAAAYLSEADLAQASAFQSLGSPAEILRLIAETAAKYATVIDMEAVEISDDHGIVSAVSVPGFPRYELLCAVTRGILGQGAELFGMPPSIVVEEQCEVRGDERCLFRVTWDSDVVDTERKLAQLELELAQSRQRVLNLQHTVRQLVSGAAVDDVLADITDQATRAVTAHRYLLVVATSDQTDDIHVHHIGFAAHEVDLEAARLRRDGGPDDDPARLVAEVVSGRRRYGWLAAYNPEGIGFYPEERRTLAAYAELAAAALDSATALEDARRQAAVARALLDLGRALARLTSAHDAAHRLAEAVPTAAGCDMASVCLFDPAERTMRIAALHGYPDDAQRLLDGLVIREEDTPALRLILDRGEPIFLDSETTDPYLSGLMQATGGRTAVVLPITNGSEIYGAVNAVSRSDSLRPDHDLLQRLAGIADQGASALQNARLLEAVQHQALHDALTDTPNQRLLEDRVEHAVAQARRGSTNVALLFLDLDRFKKINDTLGHAIGDLLLTQVAQRLRTCVREIDTVSRLGGDEFVVLLPGLSEPAESALVAQRIVEALEQPFNLDGYELFITSSIGIAGYPHDGDTYASLLKAADTAMYEAKAAGRGTFRTYARSMPNKTVDALTLEADLHGAAERGELRAVFQPLVDLHTLRVVHAEALIRWEHPRLGTLAPDAFIPLAEDSGLITTIDAWMLRTVCDQLARWQAEGHDELGVAINLSERDLRDPRLVGRVRTALGAAGVSPHRLELEITERVAESIGPVMERVLDGLSELGVRLAIDDFGTGNSAFSRLTRGRIHTLKIDRSFLAEVADEHSPAPLVTAMIALGQSLGVRIVAEGIETAGQGAFVRRHGCDLAQGFYFSRPLDLGAFEDLLRRSRDEGLQLPLEPERAPA
ncbi:MAG: EAL domain-containing protein [Actinobacteria bacterium]|nr:EAL domain-containing protein [Actinomycetota bacterium]